MTFAGLVRANNLSDVTNREKVWDNLGSGLTTGTIPIPEPSFDVNFAANQSFVDSVSGNNLFAFSRASTGTFIGSDGLVQTAASGVPRFEYDPLSGECVALLVEPSKINYIKQSQSIGTSPWVVENLTVQQNNATAPDGAVTATSLVPTAVNSNHSVSLNGGSVDTATPNNEQYRFSVYCKFNGHRYVGFYCNINLGVYGHFDLVDGVAAIGSIQELNDGWYRCTSSQYPAAANNNNNTLSIALTTSDTNYSAKGVAFLGDGVSGVFIWGAQSEPGTFVTSYVPTTTTAVTRAADVATISGTNLSSFYSANTGTIYTEQPRQASSAGVVIGDSSGNRLLDWQSSAIYRTSWGGADYTWTGASAVSGTSLNRAALSYGQGAQGAVNGTAYTLSPFVASGVFTTSSLSLQGVFSRIAFWPSQLTPAATAGITAVSNTEISYLAPSISSTYTITGRDIFALDAVNNVSTRDFVFIKSLTSSAQPRITTAIQNAASGVALRDAAMLKVSPTTSGNYFFSSGLTLSGVSTRINGTNARSISTSPFSGSTATVPLLLSNLRPQSNWRITEPMTSGTITSPSIAIPFETDTLVLFMKAGQS